jgi:hypothetical protein
MSDWVAKDEQEVNRSIPKAAHYHLGWVDEHEIYALHDTDNNQQLLSVAPGSAEWSSWLSSIPSFTFAGKLGQLTLRQEARGGLVSICMPTGGMGTRCSNAI